MDRPPKRKWRSNQFDVATVGGVILLAIIAFIYWQSEPPDWVEMADAGFKRAKASIDPEELRTWALEILERKPNHKEVYETMPESIRNLYPEFPQTPDIYVEDDCLVVLWGGGFFRWQIEIGATNYANVPNDKFTTVQWVPGIYYSHEGNRPFR